MPSWRWRLGIGATLVAALAVALVLATTRSTSKGSASRPAKKPTPAQPASLAPAALVSGAPAPDVQQGAVGVTGVAVKRSGNATAIVSYHLAQKAIVAVQVFDRAGPVLGNAASREGESGSGISIVDLSRPAPTGLRVVLVAVPVDKGGTPTVVTTVLGPAMPSFTVQSPTNNSTITGQDVAVRVHTEAFKITDQGGPPTRGMGHFHFILDKRQFIAVYGRSFNFRAVPTGEHTLVVFPAGNDHNLATGLKPVTIRFRTR